MLLDSLGELEDKRPWSTGAQSRRSCHRRSCAACFEQLAGVFASCGDRHIINYLPGSLSSEENLQMYRNDYSDNEPDIHGCRRRSVTVRSGAPQFALWASAADRLRNVMHSGSPHYEPRQLVVGGFTLHITLIITRLENYYPPTPLKIVGSADTNNVIH